MKNISIMPTIRILRLHEEYKHDANHKNTQAMKDDANHKNTQAT